MPLIIEDGTKVANSNSFVTDAQYVTYAALKGLTIGGSAALREVELLGGMDYIASKESQLQGYRESSDQSTFFPRVGVYLHGWLVATDKITEYAKNAQMEAAAYANKGVLLSNTVTDNAQSKEASGIKVQYFNGGKQSGAVLKRVSAFLNPLMTDTTKLVRT